MLLLEFPLAMTVKIVDEYSAFIIHTIFWTSATIGSSKWFVYDWAKLEPYHYAVLFNGDFALDTYCNKK